MARLGARYQSTQDWTAADAYDDIVFPQGFRRTFRLGAFTDPACGRLRIQAHGYAKLSREPEIFAVVLHTLGVPDPLFAAWAATLTELIGGAAVMAGILIPWASIPMVVVLLTALVTVHLPYGFFSVKFAEVTETGIKFGTVGYEILLLYLAGLLSLVFGGPGALSLERWLERRRNRELDRNALQSLAREP